MPKQSEILYEITISLSSLREYFSMFLEGYPKTLFLPAFFFHDYSIGPVATDFQSSSCVMWHTTAIST